MIFSGLLYRPVVLVVDFFSKIQIHRLYRLHSFRSRIVSIDIVVIRIVLIVSTLLKRPFKYSRDLNDKREILFFGVSSSLDDECEESGDIPVMSDDEVACLFSLGLESQT